jgi:hypothetical protein
LNERVKEAQSRKSELITLISTVERELGLAQSTENDQRIATQAAEESRTKLQQEALKSQALTKELADLLTRTRASETQLESAERTRAMAAKQLEDKQGKATEKDYAASVTRVWAKISTRDWNGARALLASIPDAQRGLEFKILRGACQFELTAPVRIELGSTRVDFVEDLFVRRGKYYRDVEFNVEKYPGTKLLVRFPNYYQKSPSIGIQRDASSVLEFYLEGFEEGEKILTVLSDGSILTTKSWKHHIWTFFPGEYTQSASKMLPVMEEKLKDGVLKLDIAAKNPVVEPPIELAASEVASWRSWSKFSARLSLSSDKTHVVALEYWNRDPVPEDFFSTVAELTELKHANFETSNVDDACIGSLIKCRKLEHLNLQRASNVTDAGIKQLRDLPALVFLNIGYSRATLDAIDDEILGNLEVLYLNNTALGSSRLTKLASCTKLKKLSIYSLKVQDDDLEVLKQMPSLESLDVGPATITERGIDIIDQLSNLKHLDLKQTPVSDSRVEQFRPKHPQCRVLR